jgi:outer membrane protein OmpA-like peptidoglycan-associated protein
MDLWGTVAAPAGYWSADATSLYLRLRTAADPMAGGGTLVPGTTWAVLLDLDFVPGGPTDTDWEVQVLISGAGGDVTLYQNTEDTPGTSPPIADQTGPVPPSGGGFWGTLADGGVRVVNDTASSSWLLDVALDRADLESEISLDDTTPIRVALATGTGFFAARDDTAGCDDENDDCTLLEPLLADEFFIDADEDGLSDAEEQVLGTDPEDGDTDNDGVPDGDEATGVTDDGLLPALDCDSDGDGIMDGTERAVTAPHADTDTNSPCWVPDADHESSTDPDAVDSDQGGLTDGMEDWNHDGLYDPICWETDPNSAADDTDTDADGVADVLEERAADGEVDDVDSDGDGIADAVEGLSDPDGDCIPAFVDDDSDGDGIPDDVEGGDDLDEDGVPDSLDEDSDGDGTPDDVESEDGTNLDGDVDCDGIPDWEDPDDTDGLCGEPEVDTGDFEPDPEDNGPDFSGGYFSGGSCATVPGPALGWGLVVAVAALLLGRRRRSAAVVALAVLPLGVAGAQEVDAQRFRPAVDGVRFQVVEDASPSVQAPWGFGLIANYANDPLVFRSGDDQVDEIGILESVVTSDLLGFYRLGPVRLGVDAPIHWYTAGYEIDRPVHLGDIRVSGKVDVASLFGDGMPLDLAAWADLTMPTGAAAAYVGDARLEASLGLAGSKELGNLVAAANVGFRTGHATSVGSLDIVPAIPWRFGAAYLVTDGTWVAAEVDGETWLGNGGHRGASPVELLGSGRFRTAGDLFVTLGAGTGLSQGLGAPDYRVFAGLSWSPVPRPEVAVVEVLETPDEPGEPEPVAARARLVVRTLNPSGRPIAGAEVRILGTLGLPMKTGNDGILEAGLEPGSWEVSVGAPGWVAETRTVELSVEEPVDLWFILRPEEVLIDREARQIYLNRKVFFELDKAELKVESLQTLDALVATLVAHPEITDLRIEGHTDTQGTDVYNQGLSERRASAVLGYLVQSGIGSDRVEAEGFGESRPLQLGDSEDVHATNRRVEFVIVEMGEPAE